MGNIKANDETQDVMSLTEINRQHMSDKQLTQQVFKEIQAAVVSYSGPKSIRDRNNNLIGLHFEIEAPSLAGEPTRRLLFGLIRMCRQANISFDEATVENNCYTGKIIVHILDPQQ